MNFKQVAQQISSDGTVYYSHGFVDENGDLVERTPLDYPYSYDGYITWRGGENKEANNTVYSDRLSQFDYNKTEELTLKHFGDKSQYWSGRSPEKVEAFLRDFTDNPKLKLIFIMQYCNRSSGYPVWRFDYHC